MYECHLTLDPCQGETGVDLKTLAEIHGFRVANLYKDSEGSVPSTLDAFMTAHSETFTTLQANMVLCIEALLRYGFTVRRYKIESIIIDSKYQDDPMGLLS